MLQKMRNILVVGPKKDYQRIVDVLYQSGSIHLEDIRESESPESLLLKEFEVEKAEDVSNLLTKINGIFQMLPRISNNQDKDTRIYEELRLKPLDALIERTKQVISQLESTTRNLATQKSDLELTITSLNRYEKILSKIQPIEHQLPALAGFEVTVLLIQREFQNVLEVIQPVLKDITKNQFEFISADVDEATIAAITVFNKKYSEEVHAFLFSKNVNEVRIPSEYSNLPLDQALQMIYEKREKAKEEIGGIDKKIAVLSGDWYQELSALRKVLDDRNEELTAFCKFGETDYTFVVKGWIPKKYLKLTKKALRDAFGDRVVVSELPADAKAMEQAPAFFDNPRWVKPFEFFMNLMTPPKYGEVDPSPIIAIFFPIFFGIIVGDIGYGIVIMVFALLVRWRFKTLDWLKQLMNIMIISSIPTIFFGFLFGEFFGDYGEMMGWIHPIEILGITWNRVESIIPLLVLAIAIGVIHVFLGLAIGFVNALTRKSRKHMCEKCGMMAILAGLILLIGMAVEMLPGMLLIPAIVLVIIAIPLILYGGGTQGAIEVVSTIGNILSYARLMAIGLSSVILAMVANRLGGEIGVAIIGALIAIMLHALNIVLAMFSPSIHSVRLHLVEFYSKFYEGGGIMYNPFGKKKEA
jgi:V/A-type H+-transporting ATPase subunit I